MTSLDFAYVLKWWLPFFVIGLIFLPLTITLFQKFFDRGYIFSKIVGMCLISYIIFLFGSLRILPFVEISILLVLLFFMVCNIFLFFKNSPVFWRPLLKGSWKIFLFEEILFFVALTFWSYIRAHEPSIHGLEKYMDFGFVSSILRSDYFPPADMWYTPLPINYYYFGHLVTAVLTKLSGIDSVITYNLMLATLFAFTFTGAFSIGTNLLHFAKSQISNLKSQINTNKQNSKQFENFKNWNLFGAWNLDLGILAGGFLTAFLVSMAGNLHTIYAFFKPYNVENPVPFWELIFSPDIFLNGYWYPNATRFITNTIHEFPLYSFVVSDLHGHVLDIPIVLLTIAVLLALILKSQPTNYKSQINTNDRNHKRFGFWNFNNWNLFGIWKLEIGNLLLISFLLAVMYMTNIWDAAIYGGLTFLVFGYLAYQSKNYTLYAIRYTFVIAVAIILALPFSLNFTPFASGIGILCAPQFLTNIGKLGPFLFEPDHCQQSPIWQLAILYGFFYFWIFAFFLFLFKNYKLSHLKFIGNLKLKIKNLSPSDIFVLLLILLSTLLIITPEFIYAKDIYPGHYRANTMFKLGYQAFIMLSIVSGYIIVSLFTDLKSQNSKHFWYLNFSNWRLFVIWILGFGIFALVTIYPYFAINAYYGDLKTYRGLDGLSYLKPLYPNDYEAILWIRNNVKGQPVILEANGESYTDYDRVSANTGLPTVIGWPVHEWLWRGSYDVASPRIADVQTLYETTDINVATQLIKKYTIKLIFVGDLERQKYSSLSEEKFNQLGKIIYSSGQTRIYEINPGIL